MRSASFLVARFSRYLFRNTAKHPDILGCFYNAYRDFIFVFKKIIYIIDISVVELLEFKNDKKGDPPMLSFRSPDDKKRYYYNEETRKRLIWSGKKCVILGAFLLAVGEFLSIMVNL